MFKFSLLSIPYLCHIIICLLPISSFFLETERLEIK
ncbi:unnamed protein product [Leptidea sinapis]|uniref:Uncharacterized protein n=1 Tax=Leptidea sinapis TaxID=189913 RepID=A0A5E4QAM0_9NEOP|nr:unnamed protein product [Leptidea sinapis]